MGIPLFLLCVLCVSPVHSIFDGACPRKDPPPGVLVLSPGSKLLLTCGGHVKVDGVKVSLVKNSSNTNKNRSPSDSTPPTQRNTNSSTISVKSDINPVNHAASEGSRSTEAGVSAVPGENTSFGYTDTGYTASPHTVQPTSASRPLQGESDWEAEDMDIEGDYEDEEEEAEEGSRVTRGVKSRPQWKFNRRTVGKGDSGGITFGRSGATLSLASARPSDSGKYSCHHRGIEKFSVKVVVADPPESPSLSCYKKSPSSKIRCESAPQKHIKHPACYLSLSKSPKEKFHHVKCSYSSPQSRCWCALEHNEDELRTLHMAYLCVTSITGNATSALLEFTPWSILKPDPPSNVMVRQVEGHETRMTVTWNLPTSWKQQDNYYDLTYEIKYRPAKSSFDNEQIGATEGQRSYTITDAMPGVEYLIQLRTREEYDGRWSDWSTPVYAWSWTAADMLPDDLTTTGFEFPDLEGSGSGEPTDNFLEGTEPGSAGQVSHLVLWISGLFGLLSVILAAYIFRHKDRFMSKLNSLSVIAQCGDSSQPPPSAPTAPEGQALVTFAPPQYKERSPRDTEEGQENEEERTAKERIEAMHFNNTSYFLLQRE